MQACFVKALKSNLFLTTKQSCPCRFTLCLACPCSKPISAPKHALAKTCPVLSTATEEGPNVVTVRTEHEIRRNFRTKIRRNFCFCIEVRKASGSTRENEHYWNTDFWYRPIYCIEPFHINVFKSFPYMFILFGIN